MKSILGNLTGCIFVAALLIILINRGNYVLRPSNTDQCVNAIKAFYTMPENTAEVIVYESSHAQRGVNVIEMYEKYGISAYNYGCNWQHLNTEELFFYDSLETQTPKVILIETYLINDILEDIDMDGEIYYTRYIRNSVAKKNYLQQCFGKDIERYLAYYVPIIQFHTGWTDITEDSFNEYFTIDQFVNSMGYMISPKDGSTNAEITVLDTGNFEQKELSAIAIDILDGILDTCNQNGIEVIFFTVPYAGENNYDSALRKYCKANDCTYIDFYNEMNRSELDGRFDWVDEGHLNYQGATKVADYLGKYLVESYNLTDLRDERENIFTSRVNNIEYALGENALDYFFEPCVVFRGFKPIINQSVCLSKNSATVTFFGKELHKYSGSKMLIMEIEDFPKKHLVDIYFNSHLIGTITDGEDEIFCAEIDEAFVNDYVNTVTIDLYSHSIEELHESCESGQVKLQIKNIKLTK